MKMLQTQQQPAVTYLTLTKEQLYDYSRELAKNILLDFGVTFDEIKAHFTPDTKDEYKPLSYWMAKMNVNRSTIWRWEQDGLITARRIGKKLYFCQRDFDEMFAKKKGEAATASV